MQISNMGDDMLDLEIQPDVSTNQFNGKKQKQKTIPKTPAWQMKAKEAGGEEISQRKTMRKREFTNDEE